MSYTRGFLHRIGQTAAPECLTWSVPENFQHIPEDCFAYVNELAILIKSVALNDIRELKDWIVHGLGIINWLPFLQQVFSWRFCARRVSRIVFKVQWLLLYLTINWNLGLLSLVVVLILLFSFLFSLFLVLLFARFSFVFDLPCLISHRAAIRIQ